MKVTDRCEAQGDELLFVCDFSPLKSSRAAEHVENASLLDADYISVAYNPGKAVRADSASFSRFSCIARWIAKMRPTRFPIGTWRHFK